MELEDLARKYALKNAVEHEGECNTNAVIGQIFAESEFQDKGKVGRAAGKICGEINQMSLEEQKEEIEAYEYEEPEKEEHDPIPDLEVEDGEDVVLRLAPNPNGAPHIGHGRMAVINGELKKKYDGKLILRYDDTDPQTKRPLKNEEYDAYKMQKEDFEWLGYDIDEVRYCSKNFDTYIEYAEELIEMNKAYVCFCSQEEGQKYRKEGKACPHRDQDISETFTHWEEMKKDGGAIEEGEATLKVKTDLNHKNPAIRDFVAFRIIDNPDHPITGDEYRVWPMLDFQGAIEDHEMGTTHIFRGKELRASKERQEYIYDYLNWEYPHVNHWGNVQISGLNAPVSGSELNKMIEKNELEGWSDPRAPTLRALRRRGFQPEAIREFFIEMGVTENDVDASIEGLEKANTRVIDEASDRAFFVREPISVKIEDCPNDLKAEIPVHPEYPERGNREYDLDVESSKVEVYIEENDLEDGFFRLKGLCNVRIEDGRATFEPGDHKTALKNDGDFIHWAPMSAEDAVVRMPNGDTENGLLEPKDIAIGEVVQFERFGFVRKDSEHTFFYGHQ